MKRKEKASTTTSGDIEILMHHLYKIEQRIKVLIYSCTFFFYLWLMNFTFIKMDQQIKTLIRLKFIRLDTAIKKNVEIKKIQNKGIKLDRKFMFYKNRVKKVSVLISIC